MQIVIRWLPTSFDFPHRNTIQSHSRLFVLLLLLVMCSPLPLFPFPPCSTC